jgi:hypothetical protein
MRATESFSSFKMIFVQNFNFKHNLTPISHETITASALRLSHEILVSSFCTFS